MFRVEIKTTGAAYQEGGPGAELRDNLHDIAAKLLDGYTEGAVRDSWGNNVGAWSLTED